MDVMARKKVGKQDDDKKLYALLGVLLTIVGFIIALATKKQDKYVMFYAKQGLVLFFAWVIGWFFWMIPVLGWIIGWIIYVGVATLWVIGIIYSLSGEMRKIPIIGDFADKIKI